MKILICFLWICLSLSACNQGPEPISYGKDACAHCKMSIMDDKFAAEIITAKGKIYKFDAIECMTDFIQENQEINVPEASFLAMNMVQPGNFIDAKKAYFLKDKAFKSPMGGNLAAFELKQLAENNRQNPDWEIFSWDELLENQQISTVLK